VTTTVDWTAELHAQLDWHWQHALRPRLEGLTDAEYLWEPAQQCWSIPPRGTCTSPAPIGSGAWQRDDAPDNPDPAPVTTIAWRLAHQTVECLAMRTASHVDGPAAHYETWEYAGTADEALAQLDTAYDAWAAGVLSLDADALARPCGEAEGPFASYPLAALVLHINRELIHHGAEICLLRDLYLHATHHQEPA
jgi:hypothetical protein